MKKIKSYLKLTRVKHWLKNGLIFLPIFFSKNFLNIEFVLNTILAFFTFSLATSIVYVINDINDVEKDRKHPIKKKRPLASGKISIKNAYITIGIISVLCLLLMILIYSKTKNILTIIIPLVYILINILYSKWLKNVPIIDVTIIVAGFLLRVIYGGTTINVEVSKWLYLMIMFGAFYLGFGKRRNEIMKNGDKGRKVLKLYSKEFLDKNMYVAFGLAIISYTLWCLDPATTLRIGNDFIFWTIPLLIIILQLYSLNIEKNSHGDPIEVILSDKVLISTIILYGLVMVFLMYIL